MNRFTCGTRALTFFWEHLLAGGGEPKPCGWLRDKFGLSWQVFPAALIKMHHDPDAEKARRVMNAMLGMSKLDLSELQRAYDQA